MPAEKQERIRAPAGRLRLPDSQQLLRPAIGQRMPLKSGYEKTGNRPEKQQPAPCQVDSHAGSPHQPYGHASENKQVVKVVANRFQPATESGFLKFQASDLTVATVQNTGEHRENRAEKHVPIAAECEVHTGNEAHAESKETDHVRCDREPDQLAAYRYGDSAIHSGKNSVGWFHQPAIQFLLRQEPILLGENALPLVLRHRLALDRVG